VTTHTWVIFDAVGTIMEPSPSVGEAYWKIGRRFGSRHSVEEVAARFRTRFQSFCSSGQSDHLSNEQIELSRWRQIVESVLDDVDDMEACFAAVHDHFSRPEAWRVFPDVAPTLKDLKKRA